MALESYIKSIQYVEIEVSGTSNSANLAGGTVITNCIPLMSMKISGTSDDWDDIMCDVYFTAGSPPTITVERSLSAGTISASIYIIEFDGVNVEVQQGTFSISQTATNEVIDPITLTKSAAVSYHKFTIAGDDDWDHAMVKTWFSDTTHINFERDNNKGAISGHWFLFEAQGTEFTTQTIDITIPEDSHTISQVINSVTMDKTMIIGSFLCDYNGDDSDITATRVWLEDATHVYAARYSSVFNNIIVNGWVIEFAAGSNITVQRGLFSYIADDAQESIDINEVTQVNSIVNNPMMYGLMEADGAGGTEVEGSFQKLKFVDSDTIVGDRTAISKLAFGNWEVIDFTAEEAGTTAYKDITLKTSLESALTYKDITLKTSLTEFVYVDYKDIALKTTLHSLDYKDITLKITLDSLDYKDITLKITLDSLDYKDITLKTTLESIPIYKDITLKTSLSGIVSGDTGWKSPGTMANVDRDGSDGWTTIDEAKEQNDDYAEFAISVQNDYSDWLRATNFNMGVPVGSEITGIHFQYDRHSEWEDIKDSVCRLRVTSGQKGDDKATGAEWLDTDTDTYTSKGGIGDLWGELWSVAEINNSDFGVDLSCFLDFPISDTGKVDHIRIKIYYTTAGNVGYKDVTLKTSLSAAPSLGYKDITLKTTLESIPTYKDITLKTTLESISIYKDITLKITLDSLDFKDITLKTSFAAAPILDFHDITLKTTLESAATYKDISLKITLESIPTYKDIVLKTTLESDLNYKDITLKTTLESALTYKDIVFKTSLDSLDYKDVVVKTSFSVAPSLDYKDVAIKVSLKLGEVQGYKDITLKTSITSAITYKDIVLKTSLHSLDFKDIVLKTSLESANIYKDIALKTTLESIPLFNDISIKVSLESAANYKDITLKTSLIRPPTYKDISLKTSLRLQIEVGYKDISLKVSILGGGFNDISIKVSLEAIVKEIINFTSSINQIEESTSSINQTKNFISKIDTT